MEKDKIFLAKLQLVIDTMNEIDEIIKNNPNEQQQIDYEISDYQHLLQNNDLTDERIIELAKKLKEARLVRQQLFNVSELSKIWFTNNKVLTYSDNRYQLTNAIKNKLQCLNQEYRYRVLDEDTVEHFKEATIIEAKMIKERKKKNNKFNITKEELEEKINSGMSGKEIAEELGCTPAYLCVLKKKLGVEVLQYKKRG